MKSMIIFGLFCACAALPQSFTPEVQAERQRFFQLYNKAAAAAAAAPDKAVFQQHGGYHQPSHRFAHQPAQSQVHTPKWTGPLASTVPAGLPGSVSQVRNTPEVEAAIAEFSRAYNAAVVSTRSASTPSFQPHIPVHHSAIQHNTGHYNPKQYNTGHSNTAQFNSGHYNPTHANTGHSNTAQFNSGHYNPVQYNTGHHSPAQYSTGHHSHITHPKWTGPLASTIPAGLPGSPLQVADTPEVQAAKAAFSRAFSNQLHAVLG